MRISTSLILLLCLSTILLAQDNKTQSPHDSSPGTERKVTVRPSGAQPQDQYCQPGTLTYTTNLPSSGGTWNATWTYTIPNDGVGYCGSPILQSSVGWITINWPATQCNNPPLGQLTTCVTPYIVAANTGSARQGTLSVSFGSSGTLSGPVTQLGPLETLTVGVTGSGHVTSSPSGISCPSTCAVAYSYGTTVTLTASASTGYTFSGWSGACSGTGTCKVTLYSPMNVTATFTAIPETLTVTLSGSGTVTSSPSGISCPGICATSFSYGTVVYLTAAPSSGYAFTGWSGACSGTAETCNVTMSGAKSVTATFTPPQTLTVSVSGNGSVTSSPSGISCPGTCSAAFTGTVSLYASNHGYDLANWSGGCSGRGSCVVSMNTPQAVSATFGQGLINTMAGNGTAGFAGDGGLATLAEMYYPQDIVVDAAGNVYITDTWNHRIRKVTASTGVISTVAGNGTEGYSGDGGPATSAELNAPSGVAVDGAGNIYIADSDNNRVRKVTASTGVISTVAGNGTKGYSGDGGLATNAELNTLYGPGAAVALDAAGNIYIADQFNNRIRKVTVSTGIITTVAGNGTTGYSGDGGAATNAELNGPDGVALDSAGNIYIADPYNYRVRKVTVSTGIISTVAGNGTDTYSGDGGPATSAGIYEPGKIALDAAGNIYIPDMVYYVRKVTASTGIISTFAGNGTYSYSGDGGPATGAGFYYPVGVAPDTAGNIYIADRDNQRVRVVGP